MLDRFLIDRGPRQLPLAIINLSDAGHMPMPDAGDAVTAACIIESGGSLVNTLVRDVDAMSMAHSLEVRAPYADHRVVEFALALPGELKLGDGEGKAVLRRALAVLLPTESIIALKRYFSMPLTEWVAGPLLPRVREAPGSSTAGRLFRPGTIGNVLEDAEKRRGDRAWAPLTLAAWMQHHRVSV